MGAGGGAFLPAVLRFYFGKGVSMATTFQRVEFGTKQGKAFLRRVIRESRSLSWNEEWRARASLETDWNLVFYRTVKGKAAGDPDSEIEVSTDIHVVQAGEATVHIGDPVVLPLPRAVHFNGDLPVVCDLIQRGYSLSVESSAGSESSSKHGIGFLRVRAVNRDISYYGATVGSETVTVNGRVVCSGVVSV